MTSTSIAQTADLDALDWRTPLRRARRAIVRHAWLIVLSCVVAVVLLFVYQRIFPPVYTAEAVLQAELDQDIVRSTYYANWNVFRKGDMKSEPALVTSGRVVEAVVRDLNLKFDDVHHTFVIHVTALWTDSWLGTQYRSFKEWLFPPDPSAYKPTAEEIEFARTVDAFRRSVDVDLVPNTSLARVVVKAPNGRAAEYTNRLVDTYLAERARRFRSEAEAAYKSLEGEVARAASDLAEIDQRRFLFDTQNKVVLDFEKDKLVVGSWSALRASITDLRATIASLEASRNVIERQLLTEPPEVTNAKKLEGSRTKLLLESREVELNAALQQTRDRYTADSPEVQQIERFLAETRAKLKLEVPLVEVGQDRIVSPIHTDMRQRLNAILAQLASARASLAEKQAPLAELESRMNSIPGLVQKITEMNRARESLELRYKLLRERLMMADVSRATVATIGQSVHIIDSARPSFKPVWPRNIIMVPAALATGLFIGIVVAVLRELLSDRVNRDRLSARRDMPLYAVVALRGAAQGVSSHPAGASGQSVLERLRPLP